jgi:hypothetical protein
MRSWLERIAVMILCVGAPEGTIAGPIDCGPTPAITCLSAEIFSLAKTLPKDSHYRQHVGFAEQELAPGNIKTALQYIATDDPDQPPWVDIDWIAQAGLFDRAIERAKKRSSPVERLGGLLSAARHMDKNDNLRATRIVEDVERELPSIAAADSDQYAGLLPDIVAEIWARLGQTERAARLISDSDVGSVSTLLAIASRYPAAASMREQAWRLAEHFKEPYAFQLLLEDATGRGDQAEISRAAERASRGMDGVIGGDHVDSAISLARVLLTAGSPKLSAKLVKPWPQWVNGEEAARRANTVKLLIPVLAGLAQDQDVQMAAHAASNASGRSECLSKAAEEYFRLGRSDVAQKFDVEALRVAASSPTGDPKLQWEHDAALQNLALVRADHGDIQGALDAAGELRNEAKSSEAIYYIVRRAIDGGHGPVAMPAIEAMEQHASATQNAGLLLETANAWYKIREEELARRSLAEALKMTEARQSPLAANDLAIAAELMWRIDGKGNAQALLEIVDKLQVNGPSAIDRLVEIMRPVSPAVAVQLTGRQVEVERRIDELAEIAIQIADAAK